MRLTLTVVCFIALTTPAEGQSTPDELLGKLCPPRNSYQLSADEAAVLAKLLEHYRTFEWSAERARREGTFADSNVARHAVPSLRSPQVLLLNTVPYEPAFGAALTVELQRHGISELIAKELVNAFKVHNSAPAVLTPPVIDDFVRLSCRDVFRMAYGGAKPSGDYANLSKAISISRPVFDERRTVALVLSVNDLGYVLEGQRDDMELVLLRTAGGGKWQIEWHVTIDEYLQNPETAKITVDTEDYAVFDAVLLRLAGGIFKDYACVAVVSQTRTLARGPWRALAPKTIVSASEPAANDLERRASSPQYIGTYSSNRPAKLVHREVFATLTRENRHGCEGGIRFSLPGYGTNRAIITYSLQADRPTGVEVGEGWASLTRTEEGWSVDRDSYERSFLIPR